MSNNIEKSLRDKYFDGEIFSLGEIVEDIVTKTQVKILDRGVNYVTVTCGDSTAKRWLTEITEVVLPIVTETKAIESEFVLLQNGQIRLFGHETKNFDSDISELMIEQFKLFDDLYSKHQIVKCLDFAIQESDIERTYSLLEKVEAFYIKQNVSTPFIVEALKNDTERTRLASVLAAVANTPVEKSNAKTVSGAIEALKEKYKTRQQWEVLHPFFNLAVSIGLMVSTSSLPFVPTKVSEQTIIDDITLETIEENLDLLLDDLDYEDISDTFLESEFDDISEGLSIDSRMSLSKKLRQRGAVVAVKRERALSHSASPEVIMDRARRLAETMLKRRMFHKSVTDMTRQEKERFEAGASKRKALVARLAQKLVSKVRAVQADRLHHQATSVSQHPNSTTHIVGGAS